MMHRHGHTLTGVVFHLGGNNNLRRAVRHAAGGKEHAVVREADGRRRLHRDLAVNAAAGEPAGIGQILALHAHGHNVFRLAEAGEIGDIKADLRVAVRPHAKVIAVHPDPGILVDAVEHEADASAFRLRGQREMLAVPCCAAGQVARAARAIPVKRHRHGPVVRHAHRLPVHIREILLESGRHVAIMELPVSVDRFHVHALFLLSFQRARAAVSFRKWMSSCGKGI